MDKSLLSDATSSDDSPTPGYLLNDIARATVASYQASTLTQEYLISRLSKANPNIKFKCLVVIKHVCRTGRADFKRDIAKHVDAIKECLQFRGPPDPLRGDEYYRRVREAAKECLESMFDGQVAMSTSAVAAANRIQGLGGGDVDMNASHAHKTSTASIFSSMSNTINSIRTGYEGESPYQGHPGASGSLSSSSSASSSGSLSYSVGYSGPSNPTSSYNPTSTSTSASGLTGIGNPNFKDARDDKSWYQRAAAAASSSASSMSKMSTSSNKNHGLIDEDYSSSYASNRGANAINLPTSTYNNAISSNASLTVPSNIGRVGSAAHDGVYERTLISSLTEPSGLKPVPPEDKLASFMLSINTLSPDIIGQHLIDTLNADAWQSRVKGLIVIAKIVKASDAHKIWWVDNAVEELSMLHTSDPKVAVRTQASKTLGAMGIRMSAPPPVPSTSSPSSIPSSSPVATTGSNLLFDDDYDDNASGQMSPMTATSSVTTPTHHAMAHTNDLFSGLDIGKSSTSPSSISSASQASYPVVGSSSTTAPTQPTSFDFFNSMATPAPASNSPPIPASSSYMATNPNAYQPQPSSSLLQPTIPASTSSSGGVFDFLDDASSSAPPPIPPSLPSTNLPSTSTSNMFGSMTMNPSISQPTSAPLPPPAPVASSNGYQDLLSLSSSSYPVPVMMQGYQPSMIPPYYPPQQAQQRTMQPGGSVMNINLANRKDIPMNTQSPAGSGFAFLGSNGAPAKASDSFGFITDAMKAESSTKKA